MEVHITSEGPFNWVDPDLIAELGEGATYNKERELNYKNFFAVDWHTPQYDYLRERWEPLLNSAEHTDRNSAKFALWSVVRLREIQARVKKQYGQQD